MRPRQIPSSTERESLEGYLGKQRDDFVKLLEGLSDAEARCSPTVSTLSLLGLLKHLTLWERRWFQTVIAGRLTPGDWPHSQDDWTVADFTVTDQDTVDGWIDRYRAEVSSSEQIVAACELDDFCRLDRFTSRNVRSVVQHMIEEYARHCGHADILRETILANRQSAMG